jgi:transcriptional regulator with XRE-family HTH domain
VSAPHPDDVALGRQVRQARQALGLSQRQVAERVAERLGSSFGQAQLHQREHGRTPFLAREFRHLSAVLALDDARRPWAPTVPREVLGTLCRALGVDPEHTTRIVLTGDAVEVVDERAVVGRLDGTGTP